MKRNVLFTLIVLVLTLALAAPAMVAAQGEGKARFRPGDQTIAEIAGGNPDFSTLVTAVGLADPAVFAAISNPDAELTVFAPTNAAFDALAAELGADTFNAILSDQTALTNVLLYHVVGERRPSPSVINGQNKSIPMLNGGAIYPEGKGSVWLVDANGRTGKIVAADIMARNGIIHVIDFVLVP